MYYLVTTLYTMELDSPMLTSSWVAPLISRPTFQPSLPIATPANTAVTTSSNSCSDTVHATIPLNAALHAGDGANTSRATISPGEVLLLDEAPRIATSCGAEAAASVTPSSSGVCSKTEVNASPQAALMDRRCPRLARRARRRWPLRCMLDASLLCARRRWPLSPRRATPCPRACVSVCLSAAASPRCVLVVSFSLLRACRRRPPLIAVGRLVQALFSPCAQRQPLPALDLLPMCARRRKSAVYIISLQ